MIVLDPFAREMQPDSLMKGFEIRIVQGAKSGLVRFLLCLVEQVDVDRNCKDDDEDDDHSLRVCGSLSRVRV